MDNSKYIFASKGVLSRGGIGVLKRAFKNHINEDLKKYNKDKTLAIFTEPGIDADWYKARFEELGFNTMHIDYYEMGDNCNTQIERRLYDYCYVSESDNTYRFMNQLRKSGSSDVISYSVKNGGHYIGVSAGAVLATGNISIAEEYFGEKRDGNLSDEGLNILPEKYGSVLLMPHRTKAECNRWINNSSSDELQKYDSISYIPENRYLYLDSKEVKHG